MTSDGRKVQKVEGDISVSIPTTYSTVRISVVSNYTYIGKATTGTSEASATWQIMRMEKTESATILLWADGNADYDNVWTNRESLSYS